MKTPHDHKITRCPKLGDEMTFSYCREEAGHLPCARIIICWQAVFDVPAVLRDCLTPDQCNQFTASLPKDKVTSLIEMIEKAKKQK
jgi:hypothetical protein